MPKLSKSETNYREAEGSQYCGNCSMFRRTHGKYDGICTLVEGMIYAYDTCDRWEPDEDAKRVA